MIPEPVVLFAKNIYRISTKIRLWCLVKPVFETYLEIAEKYDVSEHILGIYAQRYVYTEVFMM